MFARFVASHEQAGDEDFEAWAKRHPLDREELRSLWRRWSRLREVLGDVGLDQTRDAPLGAGPGTTEEKRVDDELVGRLARSRPKEPRYGRREELGHGGMARVYRVYDRDLDRELAMKVLGRARREGEGDDEPRPGFAPNSRALSRFLHEAQVTSKLDHPGITPVHELGVDEDGRAYFTMQLVRGARLDELIQRRRAGDLRWSERRAIEVLLKVCDAVEFAHAKGVVHRDLKPANIMVGRYGETYVIDWGLARILDGESHEHGDADPSTHALETRRSRATSTDTRSPLRTIDGDVLGTPAYMSPEQAAGRMSMVGKASDIYSLGAILYELLAGEAPYLNEGTEYDGDQMIARIAQGPPRDLAQVAPRIRPELRSICARAMAREPHARYGRVRDLAVDLRAFLEGAPVSAHRSRLHERAQRALRRHAVPIAFLGLVLVALSIGIWLERDARIDLERLTRQNFLADLRARIDEAWPPVPERVEQLENLIAETRAALATRRSSERDLERLRRRALPISDEQLEQDRLTHPLYEELTGLRSQREMLEAGRFEAAANAQLAGDHSGSIVQRIERFQEQIADLEDRLRERRTYEFDDRVDQVTHDSLVTLLAELDELGAPDLHGATLASLEERVRLARTLITDSVGRYARVWHDAIATIERAPAYAGLHLEPQLGLVPLGPDPRSGLWEFAHLWSGTVPQRDAGGELVLTESSAIVLVLVPGGEAHIGALEHDASLEPSERTVNWVTLDPYFLGKHEVTQAQWRRLSGRNESRYGIGYVAHGIETVTPLNPVENVPLARTREILGHWALTIPTEIQWEHAARGGTTGPRWTGGELADIDIGENVADYTASLYSHHLTLVRGQLPNEDGRILHAPVGSYEPNPYGFHDMLGNVAEWCRDVFLVDHGWPLRAGDGMRLHPEPSQEAVYRGGNFHGSAELARVTYRDARFGGRPDATIGIRASRPLRGNWRRDEPRGAGPEPPPSPPAIPAAVRDLLGRR